MINRFIIVILMCFSTYLIAQNNTSWQIGFGAAITKFSESDASFIGDKHLFQIPRLNLTMPITERFAVDGAFSFNTFDVGFIKNDVGYFSADLTARYYFEFANFYPYVFAGGSLVDSIRKMTPTLNIGAGVTYWFSEKWGVNSQIYYKHSFENYESMRSHLQATLGVVHSFDWGNLFGGGSAPCFD